MSRDLPARPNLDHLRKQAKEHLPELQRQNPGSKLADAQYLIAREYGFASWAALKAHVESLARVNPLAGRWRANVSKSKRHPVNRFHSASLHITVDGDMVTIAHSAVDEAGREDTGTNSVNADGSERPGSAGHSVAARWRGPRVLEVHDRKDGQIVGRGTYEVSADGGTLIVSSASAEQVLVFERQ
jgi:hypothetical protein